MRKTIGLNPLDAVVPDLAAQNGVTDEGRNNGRSRKTDAVPARPNKERLTVHISVPLIDRAKNAVFWTPGLTLADLGERALEVLVSELEKENGGPFAMRPHELKGGRPLK